MRIFKLLLSIVLVSGLFYLSKTYISFPAIETELIGIILTVSSILFGFLGAFFISELWSKYTEARSLQGVWSSNMKDVVFYASYFFENNKKFKAQFKQKVEKYCIAGLIIPWEKLEKEEPYLKEVGDTFNLIEVKNLKGGEREIFDNIMDAYSRASVTVGRLVILGKEKLFPSEWAVLFVLALTICISILFLEVTGILYGLITFVFPGIIVLILWFLYALNTLGWNIESISIEPSEKILDALGVKRFYLTQHIKMGIRPKTKDYRTEKDLSGELKKIYEQLIKK